MRVVLDTNVVISALIFRRGVTAALRDAWVAQRFTPLIDSPCADELIRALAYPKFQLGASDIHALLSDYLPFTATVDTHSQASIEIPNCSDPDDQKFLHLAAVGQADVLVTGDRALLEVSGKTGFAVEMPAVVLGRLSPSS